MARGYDVEDIMYGIKLMEMAKKDKSLMISKKDKKLIKMISGETPLEIKNFKEKNEFKKDKVREKVEAIDFDEVAFLDKYSSDQLIKIKALMTNRLISKRQISLTIEFVEGLTEGLGANLAYARAFGVDRKKASTVSSGFNSRQYVIAVKKILKSASKQLNTEMDEDEILGILMEKIREEKDPTVLIKLITKWDEIKGEIETKKIESEIEESRPFKEFSKDNLKEGDKI